LVEGPLALSHWSFRPLRGQLVVAWRFFSALFISIVQSGTVVSGRHGLILIYKNLALRRTELP
jgi:hypothetical protein